MPAAPDIIAPITADPNGPAAWVWVDSLTIDRGGSTPMPGVSGLDDRWQVRQVLRSSLAQGGALLLSDSGQEIPIGLPAGYQAEQRFDLAHLLHDAEVQQALALIRSISIRLASGSLHGSGNA